MDTDTKVQALLQKVAEKKAAIKSAERPTWETNCSFRWNRVSNDTINLHVADEKMLVDILAFLMAQVDYYALATKELEFTNPFEWQGYSFQDWKKDIKTRMNILRIGKTKKDLATLEEKLNELMSPDLKREMALKEIESLLKD